MRVGVVIAITVTGLAALTAGLTGPGSPLSTYQEKSRPARGGEGSAQILPTAPVSPATQPARPASPAPPAGPLLAARPVTVTSPGFFSWALLDTRTGAISGSANVAAPSDTASMSKAWVAADYLRRAAEKKQKPADAIMRQLSTMIRDSDTTNTFTFHVANGNLASIRRMITVCGLTDTTGVQNSWSLTKMSARDAARLAACVGDGRAAGPVWTGWLLDEMRAVRGPGRFGVVEVAPPAARVAVKNGWLLRDDGQWHIACLAVGDGWALGVLVRHPGDLGKDHGASVCRTVGEQLMAR